ncbi:MAG: tail tape measure protein [Polymorphobacter sp.]|uniref:tail tape measure protein n=1 Tax=Polymorphobacter sp. TaxID=1909290 RepID=UPI003A8AF5BF
MIEQDGALEALVVQVRADTSGFMAGVADVRRELDGPLAQGVERAGTSIERSLARAVVNGRVGFEDLRRVALRSLADIAASALRTDLSGLFGGASGGVLGVLGNTVAGLFGGVPGRATGGPVTAGRAYRVGERGPETFVPQAAGRIEPAGSGGRPATVNVTVNVAAPREANAAVMAQTGTQVARAVRRALSGGSNL